MHDELDQAVLVPLQARKLIVLGARVGELMPSRLNTGRLVDQPAGSLEDDDADPAARPSTQPANSMCRAKRRPAGAGESLRSWR